MITLHPSRRTVVSVASGLSAAVLAVAGTGVALAHHDVTLEVDGVAMPVSGFNSTVSDVLGSAGVELAAHDLVAPATDQAVSDGQTIVVRTAKPYTLTVDGKLVQAWSTGDSAQDVLADSADSGTVVLAADRSFSREPLPVLGAGGTVSVLADGEKSEVEAGADDDAEEILKAAGVEVSPIDRVALESDDSGVTLRVTRVTRGERTVEEAVAHTSEKRDDASLEKGTTKVLQEGKDGSVRTTYYEETRDGKAAVSVKVAEKRTGPVTEIVAVGTKEPVVQAATTTSSSSSSSSSSAASSSAGTATGSAPAGDWAALAQCESGGNPGAVNPAGYYGLYQFDLQTWASVGGSGLPSNASAAEQTARAQMLYAQRGWSPWSCASIVGLR
ncbi:transglycosylase family protein [Actinomyces sp.]|uniref:transglycosylase family protein n=1 Tax=Actinomyces sp. TaxID=29317 RepID=UPI0028995E6D|nr:transglycosylase family protein [Actinomyces sp.]